MTASSPSKQADEMRDAVAKLYTPWKDRKHKPKRRHKNFDESIGQDAQRVFQVRPDDILFGRGRAYQNHPGNRRMRAIVFKHKDEYDRVHRSRKREVVEATYSEITEYGARFLYKSKDEQDQDSYAIVNMQTALQKVRNTLGAKLSAKEKREAAMKIQGDADQQASSSPTLKAKDSGAGPSTMKLTKPTAAGSKLGGFDSPSMVPSPTLKMKDGLGPDGLLREPSSLLGLMPRPLSATSSMLPLPGLEASLLSRGGLYPRSLAAEAALLDPILSMGPSSSLLLGRLAPPRLPMSFMSDPRSLLGGSSSSILPPSAVSSLDEEQRRQLLASREASLMAARVAPSVGLGAPYF